jgi:hypothetical protein
LSDFKTDNSRYQRPSGGSLSRYIKSTWNHYSAVNKDNPSEKKAIDFQPVQAGQRP